MEQLISPTLYNLIFQSQFLMLKSHFRCEFNLIEVIAKKRSSFVIKTSNYFINVLKNCQFFIRKLNSKHEKIKLEKNTKNHTVVVFLLFNFYRLSTLSALPTLLENSVKLFVNLECNR